MKNKKRLESFIFKKNRKSGVALIFAMLISGIILAIALGIINIAVKEINFNTSAQSTNEAFFAADTGIECALYNDKSSGVTPFADPISGNVNCLLSGNNLTLNEGGSIPPPWVFVLSGLGESGQACAEVTVTKVFDTSSPPVLLSTSIVSTGFNMGYDDGSGHCGFSDNANRVERVLKVNY
jgi:hypothetical protein